jgi:hypothetical protein
VTWLGARFTEPEAAHRITVVQLQIGNRHGETIFTYDQKPDAAASDGKAVKGAKPRLTGERIVELAHKMIAAAQLDCDALRRSSVYAALAFHPAMGPDSYARHTFRLAPKNPYFSDGAGSGGVDTDEVHRDRLLSAALAHSRWVQEQFSEAIGGVMSLQQDIIRQQAETIARQDAERRQWIIASEEALSRKQERDIAAEWAKTKISAVNDAVSSMKVLLPSVAGILTKGKVGLRESIQGFVEALSDEAEDKLFGKYGANGDLEQAGILDREQFEFFVHILRGEIPATRIDEFVESLRPDQLAAAHQVLTPSQIESLMLIHATARAAKTGSGAPPTPAAQ